MGSNQILLIVGAFAILASLQLSINSSIIRSYTTTLDGEATIDGMSIGQAMIDEINTRIFDKMTKDSVVFWTTSLTPYNQLGPETGEIVVANERQPFQSRNRFDDADDYNRYTRIVPSPRLGDFYVRDSVYYVLASNPNQYTTTKTWFKKIIVTVTHPNMLFPVELQSLIVYRQYF